jgi:hypothetical protein
MYCTLQQQPTAVNCSAPKEWIAGSGSALPKCFQFIRDYRKLVHQPQAQDAMPAKDSADEGPSATQPHNLPYYY